MSPSSLLFLFVLLPISLILGSISGLAFSALLVYLEIPAMPEIGSLLFNLAPPFIAGTVAAVLPILTLSFIHKDENFWFIGLVLIALVLFLIGSSTAFPSQIGLLFSRSLAMEMPGFIFGTFFSITFTRVGDRFDRSFTRILLLILAVTWFASGGFYVWHIAPLTPSR